MSETARALRLAPAAARSAPFSAAAVAALAVAGAALTAGAARAQGAGSAGAELLQMTAGTRAAAFAGAYTAATGDPDGIFYNPSAAGWLDAAVGAGYQAYVEDVSFGSVSGAYDLGPLVLGGGIVFLDAGSIDEVVPDDAFGGERGQPTGETVGASEAAVRLAAALRLFDDRASVGAALGLITSDLAGVSRSGPFLDLGAQYRLRRLTLGASARNLGPELSNDEYGGAPLPAQARLGAAYDLAIGERYGATASADGIWGIHEETLGLAVGGEAGLRPADGSLAAVLRAGVTLAEGEDHLGRLRVGGGLALRGLAVDYALQTFEYLGTIHRFGIRWTR